jgi:hypothetical protein
MKIWLSCIMGASQARAKDVEITLGSSASLVLVRRINRRSWIVVGLSQPLRNCSETTRGVDATKGVNAGRGKEYWCWILLQHGGEILNVGSTTMNRPITGWDCCWANITNSMLQRHQQMWRQQREMIGPGTRTFRSDSLLQFLSTGVDIFRRRKIA